MEKDSTIRSFLQWTENYFKQNNISTPYLDSELLLSHILDIERTKLYSNLDQDLSPREIDKLKDLVLRRNQHEPLAYLVGYQYFFGYKFKVNKEVLIPRPETELLVEEILKYDLNNKSILDIGTGSGNIGITIKKQVPASHVTCSDISLQALAVAQENAAAILGHSSIRFQQSDIWNNITEKYDFIVSNPPYIPQSHLNDLGKNVKEYEPEIALNGHSQGLFFYQEILSQVKTFLVDNGYLFLEINPIIKAEIIKLSQIQELKLIKVVKDYSGFDRVVVIQNAV